MSALLIVFLILTMIVTSFLSGIFGMAGGLILVGVLLAIMPLPAAMVLHAVTQMASNGWRAWLWRSHIQWRSVAFYGCGCGLALLVWSFWRYVPDKPMALVLLGITPFLTRLMPNDFKPNPDSRPQGVIYGFICMALLLLTGVAGSLIDTFFLGGKLDRRQIVATKAACQVIGHGIKLAYFSEMIDQAASIDPLVAGLAIAASMTGTSLARRVLEAMTDVQFRTWANRIITTISGYYVAYGVWLYAVAYKLVTP
jgi:uncharacterized membrane protein YfcA